VYCGTNAGNMQGKRGTVKGPGSDPRTFGQRLRVAREGVPLSQADLGELTNVHQDTVARWERGEAKPRATSLTLLARALNTTVDWLREGGEERPPLREVQVQGTGRIEISGTARATVHETAIGGLLYRFRTHLAGLQGVLAELEGLGLRPADPSVDELGDQVAAAVKATAPAPAGRRKKRAG
jgi:transcriptional regulator with XRE-family HTH domain